MVRVALALRCTQRSAAMRAGMSNRALQRKHGVGYRTITAALNSAWPEPRKAPPKRGSRLDPYRAIIDGWLRGDLDAPRKQRHTAKRIFDRLLDEHHAIEVSYWMVREYVATRRREIRIESGSGTHQHVHPSRTPAGAGGRGRLR